MKKSKLAQSIDIKREHDTTVANVQDAMKKMILAIENQDEELMGELVKQYGEQTVRALGNKLVERGLLGRAEYGH